MNTEVTQYIDRGHAWQVDVCSRIRATVHQAVPDVDEQLQYGKPHFLRGGKHVAALHVASNKVSFMLFNASAIEPVKGVIRSMGNGERKTIDITQDTALDQELVARLLTEVSSTL